MRKNRKKVFTTLLITYSALLIVLLASVTGLFFLSADTTARNLEKTDRQIAERAVTLVDAQVDAIFTQMGLLLTDEQVDHLRLRDAYTPDDVVILMQMEKSLMSQALNNDLINYVCIYFGRTHTAMYSDGYYRYDALTYRLRNKLGISRAEWEDLLHFDSPRSIRLFSRSDGSGSIEQHLLLINKRAGANSLDSDYAVIVEIELDKLWALCNSIREDGYTLIAVEQGSEALDSQSAGFLASQTTSGDSRYSALSLLFDEEPLHVSTDSTFTGWRWHFYSSNQEDRCIFLSLFKSFLLLTLSILIIGSLFVWFVSRKQYKPLQLLISRLLFLSGSRDDETVGEYEMIDRAINRLQAKHSDTENTLFAYQQMMREVALHNMLAGNVPADATLPVLSEKYGLGFLSEQCQVILFSVDDNAVGALDADAKSSDDAFELIHSYLIEWLNNMSFGNCRTNCVKADGSIACIVSYVDDNTPEEALLAQSVQNAEQALFAIQKQFHLDLYVAVSSIDYSLKGLSRAYNEARTIQEYAILYEQKNRILDASFLPADTARDSGTFSIMAENQAMLINCLNARSYDSAWRIIQDKIVQPLQGGSSSRKKRLHAEIIREMLLEAFYEIRSDLPKDEWQKLKVDKKLYEATTLEQVSEAARQILAQLEQYKDSTENRCLRERDDQLLSYVNTHFTDPSLSILQLSEMFCMSTSNFSKTFKRIAGTGLLDYIHSLRINRAKVLLESTDQNLKSIAEAVGYSNSLTMIRAFKRYEGITPSEYKKLAGRSQ